MKKYLLVCVLFSVFFTANVAFADDAKDLKERAWQAVVDTLSWKKFWYGGFHGEECYNKLINKEVPVTFFYTKFEKDFTNECDFYDQKEIKSDYIIVYIEHTNVLFNVDGLSEKPRATIGIGEVNCERGNLFTKEGKVDDLIKTKINELIKQEKAKVEKKNFVVPKIKTLPLPAKEDNLKNKVVLEVVKRTIISLIDYYYLADNVKKYVSEQELEKINKNKKVLIGRFRETDPYLLVYYEGDNTIYFLDFPSPHTLTDKNLCLSERTSYKLDHPKGEDEKKFFQSLFDRLKSNGIALDLE